MGASSSSLIIALLSFGLNSAILPPPNGFEAAAAANGLAPAAEAKGLAAPPAGAACGAGAYICCAKGLGLPWGGAPKGGNPPNCYC